MSMRVFDASLKHRAADWQRLIKALAKRPLHWVNICLQKECSGMSGRACKAQRAVAPAIAPCWASRCSTQPARFAEITVFSTI